jgi:antitoxin VapB
MGLNIKNREAHQMAEELSKLTGESMTTAVTIALRERLARIRQEQGLSLADRLLAIGRDCAARLKEPFRSADHGDLLYDERGLPRVRANRYPVQRAQSVILCDVSIIRAFDEVR